MKQRDDNLFLSAGFRLKASEPQHGYGKNKHHCEHTSYIITQLGSDVTSQDMTTPTVNTNTVPQCIWLFYSLLL